MDANTGGMARAINPCTAKIAACPRIPMRFRALPPAHNHQCRDATRDGSQRVRVADDCRGGGFVSRNVVVRASLAAGVMCMVLGASGCATPEAEGISGRWRPVNRFSEAPQAIPLQQAYVYQASPADGTLRTMLGRWAKDANLTLAYLHPNDYTLHAPVAQIRTNSLEDAANALSVAYVDQGVRVVVERPRIIVSEVSLSHTEVAPSASLGD